MNIKEDRSQVAICEYCESGKTILSKIVANTAMLQWCCPIENPSEIDDYEYNLGCFIDSGYLRIVDLEDAQCLDHGEKIKISFCPFCGEKVRV